MKRTRFIVAVVLGMIVAGTIYWFARRGALIRTEDAVARISRIPDVQLLDSRNHPYSRLPAWLGWRLDWHLSKWDGAYGEEQTDSFVYSKESSLYEIYLFSRDGKARSISIKAVWASKEIQQELGGHIEAAFSDCWNPPVVDSGQ